MKKRKTIIENRILGLEENKKIIDDEQKKLRKELQEVIEENKIKLHPFLDEELFDKILKLKGQTVKVEITNNEGMTEYIEMTVTKKVLEKSVRRLIANTFIEFEFLKEDFN